MLDQPVADIPYRVALNLDEHVRRHNDLKMTKNFTVVVQVMAERIGVVQVAVQDLVVEKILGITSQFGWLSDDQKEVLHRSIPAEDDGDGMVLVNGLEVVLAHGGVLG
jgi:hypothetical protein